jgi:hypothetical protein
MWWSFTIYLLVVFLLYIYVFHVVLQFKSMSNASPTVVDDLVADYSKWIENEVLIKTTELPNISPVNVENNMFYHPSTRNTDHIMCSDAFLAPDTGPCNSPCLTVKTERSHEKLRVGQHEEVYVNGKRLHAGHWCVPNGFPKLPRCLYRMVAGPGRAGSTTTWLAIEKYPGYAVEGCGSGNYLWDNVLNTAVNMLDGNSRDFYEIMENGMPRFSCDCKGTGMISHPAYPGACLRDPCFIAAGISHRSSDAPGYDAKLATCDCGHADVTRLVLNPSNNQCMPATLEIEGYDSVNHVITSHQRCWGMGSTVADIRVLPPCRDIGDTHRVRQLQMKFKYIGANSDYAEASFLN